MIAHLRSKIAEAEDKQAEEYFVDPLLVLQDDWSAEIVGKEIRIHLPFSWNFEEIQSKAGLSSVQMDLNLFFVREEGSLWGTLTVIDCPDLNTACEKWVLHWLRETLEIN